MSIKPLIKIVLLGDSGVGKTALLDRFVNKTFRTRYKATIGADFVTQEIELSKGNLVTLQIWDTAGQERFNSLGTAYYRGSDCCVFVFDVTVPQTLKSLDTWKKEFEMHTSDGACNPTYIVIGNKIDLPEKQIDTEQGKAWCAEHGITHYFEASAKTSTNVEEAFKQAATSQQSRFEDVTRGYIRPEIDFNETQNTKTDNPCSC
eukprot:TRINITY_DN8680_c0_g1_i1.p1 TRINITY_DN8680_c0_g1~~TRINITY_DN8680_c0_g1_i1.p1  ORF type:complete len:204 (-),score=32.30 TRINITY_DN8680_c0_g1_i1:69-680(-)